MDRRLARAFALATIVAAALASARCARRADGPLRVGISAEPGCEFAYLAEVRHFFGREGVRVRLVQFESKSDSRRAFERGQLDGFFGTPLEVLRARANTTRSPRMVRVLDRSGEVVDVLAFDAPVLAGRPADAAAFLRAYDEAVAWTAGNSELADAIMAEREGVSPRQFREALDHDLELVSATRQAEYFGRDGLLPRIVEATSRVLRRTGMTSREISPDEVLPAGGVP